jgi:hypothetical protein
LVREFAAPADGRVDPEALHRAFTRRDPT